MDASTLATLTKEEAGLFLSAIHLPPPPVFTHCLVIDQKLQDTLETTATKINPSSEGKSADCGLPINGTPPSD